MQDNLPVTYCSKKLNSAQMNYPTIDKELLCVVATLKEFRSMLLGADIHIYTNHKNIHGIGDSSERRLCWISYVDENGPTLHYIEGPQHVIADTFSRLSRTNTLSSALVGKKVPSNVSDLNSDTGYFSLMDDQEMFTTFSNLPVFPSNDNETNCLNK
jgi:hypothetical protein